MTEEELFRKLGGFNPINNFGAPKENIAINPFTGKPIVSNAGQLATSMTRGIPQLATGFVDLAGLPFTMSGLLDDKDVFGSTAYLDSKGLLPPKQTGTGNMLAEMGSSMLNPPLAAKSALIGLAGVLNKTSKLPTNTTNFEKLSSQGKINTARTSSQELKDLKSGRQNFAELNLNPDNPKDLNKIIKLEKDGYKTIESWKINPDNPDDFMIAYKDNNILKQYKTANKQKTNYAFGKLYNYSDKDIAKFYKERGLDENIYLKDKSLWENNNYR